MKLAPIVFELRKYKNLFIHKIVHTGQHYDFTLSKVFFKDLNLPEPDIYLDAGSSSHGEQTAKIMQSFEKVVLDEIPDLVVVFGDVNSTLACSLVCSKIFHSKGKTVPVAHVEAGLRSFDSSMPEEINRVVTDMLSDFLFVTEKAGLDNLLKEGISRDRIFLTGDVMIDALVLNKGSFENSNILRKLSLKEKDFVLVTLHRPANVDNIENMKKIMGIFGKISKYLSKDKGDTEIVFPVHPRTMKMLTKFGFLRKLNSIDNLRLIEPLGYSDFIKLLISCNLVLTDSGGIQEEATFLKVPCITMRDSFERPETITIGSNTLCGLEESKIMKNIVNVFEQKYKKCKVPKLMDGKAAGRIMNVLIQNI